MDTRRKSGLTGSIMGTLATFFGLGGRGKPRYIAPVTGNRTLPEEMQKEVIALAQLKRESKNDLRKAVYHQQTRLGLFK